MAALGAVEAALRSALELLLEDVEKIALGIGTPIEDPDHPLHESVMAARAALTKGEK